MAYSPVVLFCYNRADHLKLTFEALAKCSEAKATELYIFSDGAKNEAGQAKVDEVRTYLDEVSCSDLFKSVVVKKAPRNQGLADSIISGVTEVIERFGRVIVLEDDCVVSPYFLSYMNGCLDKFENEKTIGSIAGYSPVLNFPDDYAADIYLARRSCSCGWATWTDRWRNVDWKMNNFKEFFNHREYIKRLNCNGNDRFIRLYRQSKGNGNSWSIRFGAHHAVMDWWVVYPRYSYIQNIGCDESGVHSKAGDGIKVGVDISRAMPNPDLALPRVDERIQKRMYNFYSGNVVSRIKRNAVTGFIKIRKR